MSEAPITLEEMVELFGNEMPSEVVSLLWGCPGDWTVGRLRAEVRAIANQRNREIAAAVRRGDAEPIKGGRA